MADEETSEPEPVPFLSLFPWDVERWFGSMTRALLSVAAQGAYMNLCWSAWRQQPECVLPDNDQALAKMAGCASVVEWVSIKSAVFSMEPWTYSSRGWIHDVVVDTYLESVTKYRARLASSKKAGRESARVRRSQQKSKAKATSVQRTMNPPSPSPSPSPSDGQQRTPPSPPASAGGAALEALVEGAAAYVIEKGDRAWRPVRRRLREWAKAGLGLAEMKRRIDAGDHQPRPPL